MKGNISTTRRKTEEGREQERNVHSPSSHPSASFLCLLLAKPKRRYGLEGHRTRQRRDWMDIQDEDKWNKASVCLSVYLFIYPDRKKEIFFTCYFYVLQRAENFQKILTVPY